MPLRIGVDYGGVCSIHAQSYEGKDENEEAINMPGCIEALRALRQDGHELFLVSFCGDRRAQNTARYLKPLDLFHRLFFVKHRGYKADICRFLGLDVLIDDRSDILKTIAPTQTLQFLSDGREPEPEAYKCKKTGRMIKTMPFRADWTCTSWADVLQQVPHIKALGLQPDNTVPWQTLCYRTK